MSEEQATPDRFAAEAQITNVQSLKAFAHPLRMRILEYLSDHEEATSTTLAKHLGESTGQTSYHLRQLARYGFVKEVEGKGTARERWWRSGGLNIPAAEVQTLARQTPLMQTLAEQQAHTRTEKMLQFTRRIAQEAPEWVEASANSTVVATLTAQEMLALREEVWDVLDKHTDAAKARRNAGETAGRRRARIHFDAFPLALDEDEHPEEQ
ncbi:winged helix-turn-helix domain-containing protein [Nesterenkonia alkaliphila]|uniref:Helix-turn-helix domain-containing protein n=1 Tax=Nesterenkonia alkaliphila TaxID=1463631 RepID=A0A7K1UKF1_9MICC|nr:helix-turn-helix domain-containing protein [Nesterenkonia alkaliphila]MVT26802.1 helix-turn-helix domain-containing protein [Nesterenkonia alkaliphila]GFZ81570.1 transcriptional regulator [Nesterenkonia alkaliphila]